MIIEFRFSKFSEFRISKHKSTIEFDFLFKFTSLQLISESLILISLRQ